MHLTCGYLTLVSLAIRLYGGLLALWGWVLLQAPTMKGSSTISNSSRSPSPGRPATRAQGLSTVVDSDVESAGASGIAPWALAFTVVYSFVFPVLGLQDMGYVALEGSWKLKAADNQRVLSGCLQCRGPTMFANIREHGGSNHLIFPTSLLQRYCYDASIASSWMCGAFGGKSLLRAA